jgi:hypothetical protein
MNRVDHAVRSSIRFLGIYLVACHAWAATYKWVDEDGNVQYTQTPPPAGIEAETIQPPPKVDTDAALKQLESQEKQATELQKGRHEEADKRAKAEEELALQKKNCELARKRLASYELPRVEYVQADGSRVKATEEERQEQIKKSEDMIKEFCKE